MDGKQTRVDFQYIDILDSSSIDVALFMLVSFDGIEIISYVGL